MIKLIDLYIANSSWDDDTLLTLMGGDINVDEIPAYDAVKMYGNYRVIWFDGNNIQLGATM